MTALQKIDAPEVVSQSDGLLAVIARAAADPNVDIDKLERLLAAQERVQASKAKEHYVAAKLAMRPHLPEITMKGKITIKKEGRIIQETPFARFEDIHEAVTPILTEYGFDLSFRNGMAPDGKVRVTTILTHVDGHSEETYFDLPHDSSGSKNAVQAIGSSTSYAKRYGALSILNIRVCGEDDDGNAASKPAPQEKVALIDETQRSELQALIEATASDIVAFCKFYKIGSLPELPVSKFAHAQKILKNKLTSKEEVA